MTHKEMNELANSIRKHGRDSDVLIQDIAVRMIPDEYRQDFINLAKGILPRI